jgi:hypothetical protein
MFNCIGAQSPSDERAPASADLKPRNRRCAHIVAARNRAQCLAVLIAALDRLAPLKLRQNRLAAKLHSLRFRVGAASRSALDDAAALQLRGNAKDGKDQLLEIGSRINQRFGE